MHLLVASGLGHCIAHGLPHANGQHKRRLAHGFRSKHVVFAVGLGPQSDVEVLWHIAGGRNFVSAGRVGGELALVVPHQLFGGEPAHTLHKAAFNLPDVERWVDAVPHVVQDVNGQHAVFAGEGVNGHFGASRAISKVVKRSPSEGGFVVVDFGCAVKTIAPELNAVGVGHAHHVVKAARGFGREHLAVAKLHLARAAAVEPADERCEVAADVARCKLRSAAIEVGAAGGGGGTGIGHAGSVAGGHHHAVKRHAQFVSHHLRYLGVQALAHFGAAVVHHHAAVGVHMHQRSGLVEQRGGKADAKLDRRERQPPLNHGAGRVPLGHGSAALAVAGILRQLRDERLQDVVFNRHLIVGDVARGGAIQVAQPYIQRVEPQVARHVTHDGFNHDHALWPTKAAKRSMALGVGFAAVAVDGHVF